MGTFTKHARRRNLKTKLAMASQLQGYLINRINQLNQQIAGPTIEQKNAQMMAHLMEVTCGASVSPTTE
jgi:hypothetical protein